MRSDIAQGKGVYRSADAGADVAARRAGRLAADRPHPGGSARLRTSCWVAALGHPYGAERRARRVPIERRRRAWTKVLVQGCQHRRHRHRVRRPAIRNVVYAALWQTRRTPWNVYPPSNGPGGGLYRSTDGGEHWTQAHRQRLPASAGPHRPRGGAFEAGARLRAGRCRRRRAVPLRRRAARTGRGSAATRASGSAAGISAASPLSRRTPTCVYVCNTALYRSSDGGQDVRPRSRATPRRRRLPHAVDRSGDPRSTDPRRGPGHDRERQRRRQLELLVQPADRRSSTTSSPTTGSPTGCTARSRTRARSACRAAPYTTDGDQARRSSARSTAGGESDNIAPDPRDPGHLFTAARSTARHAHRADARVDPTLAVPGHVRGDLDAAARLLAPRPHALYFAQPADLPHRDGGEHWAAISPDLTRENSGRAGEPRSGDGRGHESWLGRGAASSTPSRPRRSTIGLIWAGTDDGLVWRSRDDGAHWDNVTPAALTPWSKVGDHRAVAFRRGTPPTSRSTGTGSTTRSLTSIARTTAARAGP